jgi:hypothetical protein
MDEMRTHRNSRIRDGSASVPRQRNIRPVSSRDNADEADESIGSVWQWAVQERRRARDAAAIAQRHEDALLLAIESRRDYHTRFAAMYRRIEQRHLASARMQALHATRLQRWTQDQAGEHTLRPVFMAAVASTLGVDCAALTLFDQRQAPTMVAASDAIARSAHELEFVLGEGPATEAARRRETIVVVGSALWERWPQYGSALAELGVAAVIARPLALPTVCFGALCGFDHRPSLSQKIAGSVDVVADALTHTVLTNAPTAADEDGLAGLPLFEEADYQAVVHQATGMVSVQSGCQVSDALAMIRARAFVDEQSVEAISTRIVAGALRFQSH